MTAHIVCQGIVDFTFGSFSCFREEAMSLHQISYSLAGRQMPWASKKSVEILSDSGGE